MNSKENYAVKLIDAETTHIVRHPVLRTGKPIETCIFLGDYLETTLHLGLYSKKDIIGVTSLMASKNEIFQTSSQYQLRGMAVLKGFQGKGLGAILISEGEDILKQKHIMLVWCNARKIAVNFYKRNGFKIKGAPFEIPEIGTHYMMYKYL